MTTNQPVSRIGRREMHSSRALASALAASVLILISVWVGVEIVLAAVGQRPLLVSPLQMAERAAGAPGTTQPSMLLAAGAVVALTGLALVLLGVLPGRRSRHRLPGEHAAVIVDDDVIAAALSRVAYQRARLVPEQVTTTVARRRIDLLIRPTSGVPLDEAFIRDAVQAELARYNLTPQPRLSIRITNQGAVGA